MTGPNIPPLGHQPDHLRAGHEVLTGKSRVLGTIGVIRGTMARLMGANGQNIREMKQRQLIQSGHDPVHSEDIAEISAMTMTGDPHTIRHEFDHRFLLNHNPVDLGTDYNLIGHPPLLPITVNATVEYPHSDFWNVQRSVDDIFNRINNRDITELATLGIHFTGTPDVSMRLTEDDARRLAEILHIPYLRAHFGDASETNMAMAQSMAYEMLQAGDRNFLSVLRLADTREVEANKIRTADLRRLVRDLEKFELPSDRSFTQLETEFTAVTGQIAAFPPPPHTRDQMQNLRELRNERDAVQREMVRYNRFAQHLEAIHAQIGRTTGVVMPTAGEFFRLASGGTVARNTLLTTDSPKNIALELSSQFGEIMKEDDPSKPNTPAPRAEAPEGAEAIIRLYEAYLQKTQNLTPRMARSRAAQMFMENEYTADEHHFIDNTIRRDIAGGILTPQQGLFNGVAGYLKGFTSSGSDEARVSRIAEAAGVTRAAGEGGVLNATLRSGIFRGRWNPLRLVQGSLEAVNGVNNFLFGTRILGVTPFAKYRAAPAWGEIAGDRFKLRAAWDALREAAHHGEFTNTWYIQDQLSQVAHLLIASEHQQIADAIAKMSPEERQKMGANSVREFILNHLHDILEHGFVHGPLAKEQPHAVTATYKKAEGAKKKVGSRRRALKSWFFDEEDSPSSSADTKVHH